MSDRSTIVLEYHDLRLRRALDQKVRNLRTMLTADEDITTELDKVVCKLMKLALRTSRERTTAPPAKWMQCKLLDLLTLTEKAIERRKKCYVEDSLKAIEFHVIDNKLQHIADLHNIKEDNLTNQIVDKYRHFISPSDITIDNQIKYQNEEIKDGLFNNSSKEFLQESEYFDRHSQSPINVLTTSSVIAMDSLTEKKCVEPIRSWLQVNDEVVPYPKQELDNENFGDTESVLNTSPNQLQDIATVEINKELSKVSSSETSINKYKSKREEKKNNSSTRVIKKVARKIFGSYSLVRNPSSRYRIDSDSFNARSKRRSKENRCLTMRASKPIPESLIDLCHPELKIRRDTKAFNISSNINQINGIETQNKSSKETTENNFLIDNKQESLSEHKNIGTHLDNEAEPSNCIFDYQEQSEILCNEIDLNLFTKHEVSVENIDAQTIFLNDINEPSTSKGIRRNVSMDVQCGPDTLAAYPMLSVSTSSVRIPPTIPAGLKILDVAPPVKVDHVEFGTSTQDTINDNVTTPRSISAGIRIKDSDMIIYSTDINTPPMNQDSLQATNFTNKSPSVNLESMETAAEKQVVLVSKEAVIETHLASLPINESASKPYVDSDSASKVVNMSSNSTKDASKQSIINSFESVANSSKAEESKPVLSCGGVHVHSYKDKQQCEDIVYQGEWQRFRSKIIRKKMHNSIVAKKINESCKKPSDISKEQLMITKEKYIVNRAEKTEKMVAVKKPLQMRKAKQDATSHEVNKLGPLVSKNVKTPKIIRLLNTVNNVTKVASKISISAMSSKNIKSAFTAKKPHITSAIKRKDKSQQNQRAKPTNTVKQDTQTSDKSKLKIVDSTAANSDKNLIKITSIKSNSPIARLKTKEIDEDLLNFSGIIPKTTFIVCRNDKQEDSTQEDSPVNSSSKKDLRKENLKYTKRAFSPPSLNSSTCSSPNSIATVRAIKSKNQTCRKYSSSSYATCCTTSESDNSTPSKVKRVLKSYKSAKQSSNNNKENIPIATENCASKENEEPAKSLYSGHQNSDCIAKMNTDCLSFQTTPGILLKQQALKKSNFNIEIPTPGRFVEEDLPVSASSSQKGSSKTNSSFLNSGVKLTQDIKSYDSLKYGNMVLVVQPQEKLIEYQKSADTMANTDTSLLMDSLSSSNVDNEVKKFPIIIKQLVEDFVDAIDYPNVGYCGAEHFRIASTFDDSLVNKVDLNESSISFKTITADSFSSDVESSLTHTFDLKIADQTDLMDMEFKRPSVKGVTLLTNQSEYFLADSELDAAVAPIEQTQTFVQSSITDIFERKERHLIQVPPGLISIQAFSELSFDGGPLTGDHPDPISLIDSETGSLAIDVARLTASEELIISGRSSDSFESCLLDEDAVVPSWLFEIINHQQSVEDEQPPVIGPQPEPIPQPVYDVNGNLIDPGVMSVAAGAGDGRGIHSDLSQDSSGRGTTTSISSSETSSSSTQSEDVPINPTTFTTQYQSLRGIVDGLVVTTVEMNDDNLLAEGSRLLEDTDTSDLTGHSHRLLQPLLNPFSDIDGDVSSLDTDVPDSSDN